jgi:hypothetical protein
MAIENANNISSVGDCKAVADNKFVKIVENAKKKIKELKDDGVKVFYSFKDGKTYFSVSSSADGSVIGVTPLSDVINTAADFFNTGLSKEKAFMLIQIVENSINEYQKTELIED